MHRVSARALCAAFIGLAGVIGVLGPAMADAAGQTTQPTSGATTGQAHPGAAIPLPATARDARVLRGDFVQKKYLAELDQPLISRGHYVVARGRGLLWAVDRPIKSQLVITPDALTERSGDQQTLHISVDQQPALGAVASILLAVFRGNTEQLERYFKVTDRQSSASGWSATLVPRSDAVGQFITRLDIQGDSAVRQIHIKQPGGDHSDIALSPTAAGSDSLTADEKAAFSR